jgi:hypothetical protein
MKVRNQVKKFGQKLAVVAAPVVAFGITAAHAAIDLSADATAAKADVVTNGEIILGIIFAVATFSWIRRVIR